MNSEPVRNRNRPLWIHCCRRQEVQELHASNKYTSNLNRNKESSPHVIKSYIVGNVRFRLQQQQLNELKFRSYRKTWLVKQRHGGFSSKNARVLSRANSNCWVLTLKWHQNLITSWMLEEFMSTEGECATGRWGDTGFITLMLEPRSSFHGVRRAWVAYVCAPSSWGPGHAGRWLPPPAGWRERWSPGWALSPPEGWHSLQHLSVGLEIAWCRSSYGLKSSSSGPWPFLRTYAELMGTSAGRGVGWSQGRVQGPGWGWQWGRAPGPSRIVCWYRGSLRAGWSFGRLWWWWWRWKGLPWLAPWMLWDQMCLCRWSWRNLQALSSLQSWVLREGQKECGMSNEVYHRHRY